MQYAWQAVDRVGRDDVAQAIAQAEADIERALGYRLIPSWETDEWQEPPRPYHKEFVNLSVTDLRGFQQPVRPTWGWLISGGIRGKTVIATDQAIVYSDEDGDGYDETATVTATVAAGQEACEVHVFTPAANIPNGTAGDDRYEIRPITVSIVGTTATIRFRREQCVLPELQEDYVPDPSDSQIRGVDGAVDANFLEEVDVYRIYNDPQTQVSFLWEPFNGGCGCSDGGCELCSYATQTGCLLIRGTPRNAMFSIHPGDWNATTEVFDGTEWSLNRQPELARLYYYAGYRDKRQDCPTIQMDPELELMVAYHAAGLLERGVCECSNVHDFIKKWQADYFTSNDDGPLVGTPPQGADNPLGTTRGAFFAWQRINREEMARGRLIHA